MIRKKVISTGVFAVICCNIVMAESKPLKVYILAGQSNMQGQARVETFDYIGDDPETAPLLKEMLSPDGKPAVCDRVWISYLTGSSEGNGEGFGKLTAGYGARKVPTEDGGKIGPEFTFGLAMQRAYDGPILLIKTAWGGKNLHTQFRPPSAGKTQLNEFQKELYAKSGQTEKRLASIDEECHKYYRFMIDHVRKVLDDPKRIVPDYDPKAGYVIAGFVWFQGWNDMCDSHTYPNRDKPGGYDMYSDLLAQFIRDVRQDLPAPKMPFVIGVMGVGGEDATGGVALIRPAMAAPAAMPEFKGNVAAVQTAPYWDDKLAAIESKFGKPKKIEYYLKKGGVPGKVVSDNFPVAYAMRKEYWDTDPKERKMTREEQKAYVEAYRSRTITPEEEALWKRGASNGGYHYLGSAKTMALIGNAFAGAMLELEKDKQHQ